MATHKKSKEKITEYQYKRHGTTHLVGVTNPFDHADGVLQNTGAENQLSTTFAKAGKKIHGLDYGDNYDGRHVRVFLRKQLDGSVIRQIKVYGNMIKHASKDERSDELKSLQRQDGKIISRDEWEKAGKTGAQLISKGKGEFSLIQKQKEYEKNQHFAYLNQEVA